MNDRSSDFLPTRLLLHFWLLAAVVLSFLVIGGCGGGTMGTQTGEQRVEVVGTYLDSSGKPVAGVAVVLLDSAGNPVASTETDAQGFYVVAVSNSDTSLSVQFTNNDRVSTVDISVPNETDVTVTVNVTEKSGDAPPDVVVVVNEATPTPTPIPPATATPGEPPSTPTPGDGATPTPTPAPLPTKTPEATPTPTPVVDALECPKAEAAAGSCCAYFWESESYCECFVDGVDRCVGVVNVP